jgi:hypothetical protein
MRTAKAGSFFDGWKPKEGISHKAPYDCLWMGLFMLNLHDIPINYYRKELRKRLIVGNVLTMS